MITALLIAAIVLAPAPTQTVEGCHWNNSSWVYDDGSPCRGTGEDPTVGSDGLPACADGRLAISQGDRVMCTACPGLDMPNSHVNALTWHIDVVKGGSHGRVHKASFVLRGHGKG
jgi:hypothetical protein